ncbi:MAG: hypothetical protein U5K81_01620 [Trueperaceae bacterium]|nr:hypothetical protein [Trueperaceae bacterium]
MNGRRNGIGGARHIGTRLLVLALGFGLILMSPGAERFAIAQMNQETEEEVRASVDEIFGPLEEIRASLDPRRFDVDELALDLAFEDAPTITDYVHERLAFEPYRGVLRGARGALAGGSGNAWDQALLTAILLGDAGYEVEVRRATLDEAAVDRLLAEVRPAGRDEVSLEGVEVALGDVGGVEALRGTLDERREALLGEVGTAERRLADALPASSTGDAAMSRVRDAVRDYAWVAYRFSADEPWAHAHPVLGSDAEALDGLEAEEAYEGALPDEVQHRIRIRSLVEQRLGSELRVHEVAAPWERPVANMYGVPFTYMNLPDGVDSAPEGAGPAEILERTSFLFPFVGGDMADGAMGFDMSGNAVDAMAAESAFAGVFQSVGGAVGDAAGALGGLSLGGDDEEPEPTGDAVALTAQWLEFTLIAPGGEETTHRRMVVDRIGAEARQEGSVRLEAGVSEEEAFAALMSSHTVMVQTNRFGQAFLADRVSEGLLASRDHVEEAWAAILTGSEPPVMDPGAADAQTVVAPLLMYGLFDEAPLDEDVVSYRPSPAVSVLSQRLDGTAPQVDVVANPRWSLRTGPDGPVYDAAASRAAGAWETRMEGLVLQARGEAEIPAYASLDRVDASSWRALEPGDAEVLAELSLPEATRRAMAQDLERGYQVYAPAEMAEGQRVAGWWRVDPVTGETLGRGGDGRGQAGVEYMSNLQLAGSIIPAIGFTLHGVHGCTEIEDAEKAGCCIVQNIALMPIGFAGGMVMGAALSLSALASFVAFDVVGNVAMSQIPSVCGS